MSEREEAVEEIKKMSAKEWFVRTAEAVGEKDEEMDSIESRPRVSYGAPTQEAQKQESDVILFVIQTFRRTLFQTSP